MINKIASGSSGNCIIYHKEIMVDIGVAYIHVEPFLADVKYILLTHEHKDHINITTLKRAIKQYPNIRIICAEFMITELDGLEAIIINNGEWLQIGEYQIARVNLIHDVPNIGYRIFKLLPDFHVNRGVHVTDTYSLEGIIAEDYDWYAVELNHCELLIEKAIQEKANNGVFAYERYSQHNHHSNQRGFKWLDENNVNGMIIPLHISTNVGDVKQIQNEIGKRGWKLHDHI